MDGSQGFGTDVTAFTLNGASAKVERLAAVPGTNTSQPFNVTVYGTLFVSAAVRKLVTVNMTSGAVTLVSSTTLAFNPQCTCTHSGRPSCGLLVVGCWRVCACRR